MRRGLIIAMAILGLTVSVYLVHRTADRMYFAEKRMLQTQIQTVSARLYDYQKARVDRKRVEQEIQGYVDRTLGGDLEIVDHRLRNRLSRIAQQIGLRKDFVVDTSKTPRFKDSPAKTEFSRAGFQKALREENDFAELEGWIIGTGTLEQVLKLIDAVDSEPWLKRIDQLILNPSDNGNQVQIEIRLTSIYLPRRTPNEEATAPTTASNGGRYERLLKTNLFRVPPQVPAPAKIAVAAPERFPFNQWFLTGIAQSAAGAEVWLLNQQSRETRVLNVGQRIDELTLAGVNGESAVFLVGPDRFTIAVGKDLNDRTPLKQ